MAASSDANAFFSDLQPHLKAGYNLARWLLGNDSDADDALQEAALRAYRYSTGRRGEDFRAWFLQIVRNSSYTLRRQNSRQISQSIARDDMSDADILDPQPGPEDALVAQATADEVRGALEALDPDHRAILVLRELEDLSYEQIAVALEIAPGTVMSRLSRARAKFKAILIRANFGSGRPTV